MDKAKNNYKITITSGDKEVWSTEVKNVRTDEEAVLICITPDQCFGDVCECNILNIKGMGDFLIHDYRTQEDLINFIRGITPRDGDTAGTTYMMRLDIDHDGKPLYKLLTSKISDRKDY